MPGIDYTIAAHDAGFQHGMHAATEAMEKLHEKTKEGVIHFLEFVGVAVTVKEAMQQLGEAFEKGGKLEILSMRTGAAVKDLAVLTQMFITSGSSAEAVGPMINRMQKALTGVNEEGQSTAKAFDFLHLNMEQLKDKSTIEQFQAISGAIAGLDSPAKRAAAAMGIFGRAGAEMLPLFMSKGAMAMAKDTLGNQAELFEENAESFHKVTALMESWKTKLEGFFVNVAAHISKPVEEAFEKINQNHSLEKWGEATGRMIEAVLAEFASGAWLDDLQIALFSVFESAVQFFVDRMNAPMKVFDEIFGTDIYKVPDFKWNVLDGMRKERDEKYNSTIEEWRKPGEEKHESSEKGEKPAVEIALPASHAEAWKEAGMGVHNSLASIGINMGKDATISLAEKTVAATERTATALDKILASPKGYAGSAFF